MPELLRHDHAPTFEKHMMTNPGKGIYDPAFVKDLFDRCSTKYILFSYVCSMGFTERWRRECVDALPQTHDTPETCYDLMAGTGEIWPHVLKRYPDLKKVVAVDISSGMHKRALKRLHEMRSDKIGFIEDDVLASNLPAASADLIVSTFGLKTFNSDQHQKLAELTASTLKAGGSFCFIEASDPKGWWLRPLYIFYLKQVLPMVEKVFLKGARDFAMIGTYSTNFGDASNLAAQLRAEGLDVTFRKHFFGCATSVSGRRPVA